MKGTIAFIVFFLLIAPKSRAMLAAWVEDAGKWVIVWAPLSFIVIAIVLAASIAAAVLMVKWPKVEEPENPLARYKAAEDVLE